MEQALSQSRENTIESQKKQGEALVEIQSLQREIKRNILKNEQDVASLEKNREHTQAEIATLQTRQKESATFIRKTFVAEYKNKLQTANTPWALLLSPESLGKVMNQDATLSTIKNTTEDILSHQKSLQENLDALQKNLSDTLTSKKQLLEELAKNRDELKQAQEVEQNILANIHQKEDTINTSLSGLANKKMTVQAKIIQKKAENTTKFEIKFSEYENTLKARFAGYNCGTEVSPACTWMNQYLSMEREMLTKDTWNTTFSWPLVPNNWFGYTFRDQKYYIANNTHHEWLDILTPLGIPVQSIADGYILIKQNPSSTSPGVVIVKHPGNYMSVYVGINPNRKPMFSRVSAGDSLWTTRQYAEPGEQNNVHIELYDHGKAIDPIEVLNLSTLKAESIPARYGWKYVDDLKKMKSTVNISSLQKSIGFFYIDGATEPERQKNFLSLYAATDFQDRALWVQESLPESVDPTFVMCVWFAESSLGKNLTTSGNIGNVGNTDSGLRKDFDNARSGVRAIASVVNNNWLGGYTTLNQLSGWGNPKGPIYASSRTNWHENIIKCMSAMKQRFVGNNSPFRLTQADLLLYQQEGFSNQKDS